MDSDEEHDHYLERMKQEGQAVQMVEDSDEEEDEDFAPDQEEDDVGGCVKYFFFTGVMF